MRGIDSHEAVRWIIDQSVVEAVSLSDVEFMREHVEVCVACRKHLESCGRVVAGLGGFSFGEDPMLRAKVMASLTRRAEELEGCRLVWRRFLIAVMLTVLGSFAAAQVSGWLAVLLHVDAAQMRAGLIAFWIVPSLLMCALLPILPMLSGEWMGKRGRTV